MISRRRLAGVAALALLPLTGLGWTNKPKPVTVTKLAMQVHQHPHIGAVGVPYSDTNYVHVSLQGFVTDPQQFADALALGTNGTITISN